MLIKYNEVSIKTISYKEAIGISLMEYANMNLDFKDVLFNALGSAKGNLEHAIKYKNISAIKALMPRDTEDAVLRMNWLLAALYNDRSEEALRASNTLLAWKKEQEENSPDPKQLVVGVIQVAIPGVTLGRIKRKKRKAMILIDKNIYADSNLKLSKDINRTVLEMFEMSLAEADNDIKNIEPETLEWFFGEKYISLYYAENSALDTIKNKFDSIKAPCAHLKENNAIKIIAISPVVNEEWLTAWKLKPLDV